MRKDSELMEFVEEHEETNCLLVKENEQLKDALAKQSHETE